MNGPLQSEREAFVRENPAFELDKNGEIHPLATNSNGEIKGHGAPWACAGHGDEGHDYLKCTACHSNYDRHLGKCRPGVSP
jgi:hypothetical protein